MIKILIADDHPIVRAGLKQILAEASDIEVTAEAGDGHDLLRLIRKGGIDVVLLDITMPGLTGLDALKQIKVENPDLPILVLSMHPEDQYGIRVLKAGAGGYLMKSAAPDQLVGAIRKVYRGGKYVSPSLAEKMAFGLQTGASGLPHEVLSDREYQVLCMIASGKTVKEIAAELALSEKTVSTYRARILEKMNMKSNSELTHYAIKLDLVD
jgi:two-component system, NarL family, invasion response regulator UvrY